ncbi:uncharacterized protein [Excalfactoria chinensis]|uniref:uncharacterized protein n=1 Tax=Excalfactoria chinensis TaxID=46218 RepID=UPI003B3A3E51
MARARGSGSRRAQADRPELGQGLPRGNGSGEGRRTLSALPPLPLRAVPLTAAPRNAATAGGQVPRLPTLPPVASGSFPRGRAGAVGAATSRVAVPGLEGWQADLSVPALPLKPAERTRKCLDLTYWMRLGASRPGPWMKPAGPGQRASTSTVRTPLATTQVLVPEAEKDPEDEKQPAASAQEGTGDADRVSTSRSLAAEQAADDGAEGAGTSQADRVSTSHSLAAEKAADDGAEGAVDSQADRVSTSRYLAAEQAADDGAEGAGTSEAILDAEDSKERACSARRGGRFLPYCLCCSTCSAVETDEQEEGKDTAERDHVAVAGKEPVSTSFPGAEALPPASPEPENLQHEVDGLELEDTFTHSDVSGEGSQPQPTCGPSMYVPEPPLKPAHATRKFYNLAHRRHPIATGPCQKPTSTRQRAATSTEETAAQAAQVLTPQAGSSPTDQTPPAPSAQEGTGDAVSAPASHSLEAEQAAEDGARAAGTPQDMLDNKDDEEGTLSGMTGDTMSYCLCCSTCNSLMDEDE